MSNYETLEQMIEKDGGARLAASWTPSNGIRIGIICHFDEEEKELSPAGDDGWDMCWREFDFTREQARELGEALIRWSNDRH
jgi:hypothetical protein